MTMRQIIIDHILLPSLKDLYAKDYSNIMYGVSERNISARLSYHMELRMRAFDSANNSRMFTDYFVDVEYNRMGNGLLKQYENSEHRPVYMVSDLLIHSRGYLPNLLAVELKREGNKKGVETDRNRLMSLVSPASDSNMENRCVHDTMLGAFIVFSKDRVTIELYESTNGFGINTDIITMIYGNGELV